MSDNTPPVKAKKQITVKDDCSNGAHTFIVSKWTTTGGYQKATHMICRHCLMPIELNEASKDWVVSREWLTKKEG